MNTSTEASAATSVVLKVIGGLNAEGINRLIAGDGEGAIYCIRLALTALNEHLDGPSSLSEENLMCNANMTNPRQPWTQVPILSMDDGAFYVHNQAICVNSEEVTGSHDVTEASFILLFNLALCYHSLGMKSGNPQKLIKACNIYQLCATNVLLEEMIAHESVEILAYLCWNNEAHIHYCLLNNPERALEILEAIPPHQDLVDATGTNQHDDGMQCFLTGVMFNLMLIPLTLVKVSAAAEAA